MLKLSVLDQSPISEKKTAADALMDTIVFAQKIESLGFTRFWVSEHHNAFNLAGSSPEVLLAFLAAKTSKIRLGSGGVMLPNYSSYKVAENFRVLEALAPGRIDLGIGKSPGGNPLAAKALKNGEDWKADNYLQQINDLLYYMEDNLPNDHPYYGLKATPIVTSKPDIWLLSTGGSSVQIAAKKGLSFNYAHFIHPIVGPSIIQSYKDNFVPSIYHKEPHAIVTTYFVCSNSEKEAEELALIFDLHLLLIQKGIQLHGIPSIESARNYTYSPSDKIIIEQNRQKILIGTPETVKNQLLKLQMEHEVDEIMLVSLLPDIDIKIKSFELIADAIQLNPQYTMYR